MVAPKLITLMKKCSTLKQANQIHAHILINGLTHLQPLLIHHILLRDVTNYKTIVHYVHLILHHLRNPDSFSWGCVIRFFSQKGQFIEAVSLYVQMQRMGLCPSSYAISSALKSCAGLQDKLGGVSIHGQVHLFGFNTCVYVQTALLDLYSKMGDMGIARKVFDEMADKNVVSWNSLLYGILKAGNLDEARDFFDDIPKKDVISWNSMIAGYAKGGNMDHACSLFQQMPERSLASWNTMIAGYIDCGNIVSAREFFDAMPRKNSVSLITMIAGYSKSGDVDSARKLFDQMDEKDLCSYNAMIACYAQNSKPKETLELFNDMLRPDIYVHPDKMTLASVISACSQLGDLEHWCWIVSHMNDFGIVLDDHLATASIDLYAKCGSIDKAYELFHGLRKRDLVAYSAMIYGCGINGRASDAIKLFEQMLREGIGPNVVTYIGLLTAYNHAGLVEEGYQCFNSMKDNGVVPSVDHYGIMVDLLGRAGWLDEAYKLIINMPMQPNAGVWGALLLACRLHNNVELGEIAVQHCIKLESDTTGYCSLLSSIYATVGKWDDAKRLRMSVERNKIIKIPGCSWTQLI
ncbi:pentatricopeptide repeat-containing protein At4g22760 [Gastrolobium bilobum]|uniref:pentatricopeptide repeat-containing protein At4g22760 n=1 Tax=Gastrolobium bilobum TaxID=150636 RepID=UPI002AAF72B2|nr:pentatricopeptide repeat-containing protein At4g22760 [Gastrolobium bilobum]